MQTKGLGKKGLFTGVERVKGFFFSDEAPVREIEYPYRNCPRAKFYHLLPGRALVIGRWQGGLNDDDDIDAHLLAALRGNLEA